MDKSRINSRSLFSYSRSLSPIFLIIFLDTIVTTFIIPLLIPMIMEHPRSVMSDQVTLQTRSSIYAITVLLYALAMILSGPILGSLSDRIGRKRVLYICLIGVLIGTLFTVLSLSLRSIIFLVIGRFLAGLNAGTLASSYAALVDIKQERKTNAFTWLILAQTLGFMLSPFVSIVLSSPQLVRWFNFNIPFYFAIVLAIANLFILHFWFKETHVQRKFSKLGPLSGLSVLCAAFCTPGIRSLTAAFLFLILGFTTFFQFINLFLSLQYGFSYNDTGLLIAYIGISFVVALLIIFRLFKMLFTLNQLLVGTTVFITVFMLALLLMKQASVPWAFGVCTGIALAMAYTTIVSLYSNRVGADQQGWIMGLAAAILGLAYGIAAFTGGFLVSQGAYVPMWAVFGCFLISSAAAIRFASRY